MKEEELRNRELKLSERIPKLQKMRKQYNGYRGHIRSPYFRSALMGEHPYLDRSTDRQTYLARHGSFSAVTEDKIAALIAEARRLPTVQTQRWDQPRDVRIGIVADRFLFSSLKDSAYLVPLDPELYREQMSDIDLLLLTSAWRGLEGEWHNLPLRASEAYQTIESGIVPFARERGIPVAFYSKEDPPNFDKFLNLAKLADYVFTTAIESVPRYQSVLRDSVPVHVLPFGVNFRYHNPLGCMRHAQNDYVFAGSYFEHKYPDRRRAALRLFDGVLSAGADLTIIDRNLGLDPGDFANADRYLFPERYLPYLHGPVDHAELILLQRLLPVGINLNSVVSSQTMFANRVVEMQAMGTQVLSNYNAGVNSQFPHILSPDSCEDVRHVISTSTSRSVRDAQVEGIRSAYSRNTSFDRMDDLLGAMGIQHERPNHRIFATGLSDEAYSRMSLSPIASSKLVHLPDPNTSVFRGSTEGDVLIDFRDNTRFGPNLVQDVVNAFRYTDSDTIAVQEMGHDSSSLYERAESLAFSDGQIVANWVPAGVALREVSSVNRSSVSIASEFRLDGREIAHVYSKSPELTVVVPVFNNGKHLKYKCFESLRRSSIFDKSIILLVDDGSTDVNTKWVVEELETLYSNVRVYRFPEGGSGSASRPRNKGLELTNTRYVTYLDPDNEQTNDGYEILLQMMKEDSFNFAIGNMIRFKSGRAVINNASILEKVVDSDGAVEEGALSRIKFQPMSIQALVADAEWLKKLGIFQPVGAVGQDSYFFQQMIFYATRIGVTKLPIHTYYAAVSNSTVNSLGPRFYEKYFPLEEHRSKWLREVGLIDDYNALRLEPFAKGWFMKKLENVAAEDQERCRQMIGKLLAFYGKDELEDPELRALATAVADD